jgi:hypothetical protein
LIGGAAIAERIMQTRMAAFASDHTAQEPFYNLFSPTFSADKGFRGPACSGVRFVPKADIA